MIRKGGGCNFPKYQAAHCLFIILIALVVILFPLAWDRECRRMGAADAPAVGK